MQLEQMWRTGMFDAEIAVELNRSPESIRKCRNRLGMLNEAYSCFPGEWLATVSFPKFEDITKAEAREILKTAPPSGRFSYVHTYSLTGCAAEMCDESEVWTRKR